ncbi:MAG: large subunit ribosomal protein [Patescibacteria group bacterium]|nr:large subunit ribosomal protein [Patescibacteria group bacterium]
MKIILLKDVVKVGKKYDIKDVAEGFALNMLIPRKLAVVATPHAISNIEKTKANDMAEKKIQEDLLAMNLQTIKGLTLTLKEKVNEKGHLFAGITKEILVAEILKATRLNLGTEYIVLDKPIKEVGTHMVTVEAGGKKVEFTVVVEAQ